MAAVVAIGVVLAGTACGSDSGAAPPPSPSTPTPSPTPSPPPTTSAFDAARHAACGGQPFNPRAVRPLSRRMRAYKGSGIHPVQLVQMYSYDFSPELPLAWNAASGPIMATQLVLCEYVDGKYRGKIVDQCTYQQADGTTKTVNVRRTRFLYRLFEASTGRPVTTFTVMGSQSACPRSPQTTAKEYPQYVDGPDLVTKLKPYATGPARHA
ncbi:hypothetical protein FB561_6770 [Kribbella amoyensis]|uniref:Uncharacterized protein n=2 Tax=Kribbella amoyensis TaxID=996641 RepID=A0A561B9E5_9ACTN|nr:hypothetical protein FB561_6770 [Kribbella amoyensis]